MIYEDKTLILRQGLFEVQNVVGLGRSEEVYHQAYRLWLAAHDVPHQSKPPHEIQLDGDVVHVLYPDIVAWDCITIELKSLARHLRDEERVQIHNYLKRRGDRLGLLVNMGLERVGVERIVHDTPNYELIEDWNAWNLPMAGESRDPGHVLRTILHALFQQHQTGYGSEIVDKLVLAGLHKNGVSVVTNPTGLSRFRDYDLGESPLDCHVVGHQTLFVFSALFDDNQFNLHRTRSFMKCLGMHRGLAVNFGKKNLEIHALASTS